ncbi:MAG: hypothetical protein Q9160_002549 [Pyrenula sp. 1 TL-2023]
MADFSELQTLTSEDRFLKSDTFAFDFPSENVTLNVHRNIFKDHSDPLHRMINHDMREGKEGKATLEETDSETFIRVAQWAYTGNYIVKPCLLPPPSRSQNDSSAAANAQKHDTSTADLAQQMENLRIHPVDNFIVTCRPYRDRPKNTGETPKQSPNNLPIQLNRFASKRFSSGHVPHHTLSNFLHASDDVLRHSNPLDFPIDADNRTISDLIAHAKLYTFADTYLMDSLKGFTLHKLHSALLSFPLLTHPHGIQTFTSLLTYIFTHPTMETIRRSPSPPPPPPPTSIYVSRAHSESQLLHLFDPAHLMNVIALRSVTSYGGHWQLAFTSPETCKAAMDAQPEERKHARKGYRGPLVKYWEDKPPKAHALARRGPPSHCHKHSDSSTSMYGQSSNGFGTFNASFNRNGRMRFVCGTEPNSDSYASSSQFATRDGTNRVPGTPLRPAHIHAFRGRRNSASPSSTSHQGAQHHLPRPYAANPGSMRTLVVDYAVAWRAELVKRAEFMDLFEELPGAMKAIFEAAVGGGAGEKKGGKGKERAEQQD